MTVTLLVISDGRREYIEQTIPSALAMLNGPITKRIIYDDTGDALERDWLREQFPTFTVAHHPDGRQGFGGAIRFMWAWLAEHDTNDHVFHLEQDFTCNGPIDVAAMCSLLDSHPSLVQVALKRQPWSDAERAAGGFMEPAEDFDEFEQKPWSSPGPGVRFIKHRAFFSTNPCVYRRSLCKRGWPEDPHSEGKFSAIIREESVAAPFAYWGWRDDPPLVTHIGRERVGSGY